MTTTAPARLEDVVVERIRAAFSELMPDEQWTALVQREIANFTQADNSYKGSGRSSLQSMIHKALEAKFAKQIDAALASPEFATVWGACGEEPSEGIKNIVRALTPEIIQAAYGSMFQASVQHVKNALTQSMQRGY